MPAGMERTYVIHTDGYFQEITGRVAPLPFHAMSNYPYPASEHYPTDAAHQSYLRDFETRVHHGPAQPGPLDRVREWLSSAVDAVRRLAEVAWQPVPRSVRLAAAQPKALPGTTRHVPEPGGRHYSIDSDQFVTLALSAASAPGTYMPAAGWESAGTSTPPTPDSPGAAVGAGPLGNLAAVDGALWSTNLTTADHAWNWQIAKFTLSAADVGRLSELRVVWQGRGEPTAGYRTRFAVWNPGTSSWDSTLTATALGTTGSFLFSKAAVPSSVCLSCHDGTTPAGVVVPNGVVNVGATWVNTSTASFHSAYAPSGGNGGGLIPLYTRGVAPNIPCATCHDPHGTANIFHIPTSVEGRSGISVTNGASAERLCGACHTGNANDWHFGCSGPGSCHYTMAHTSDHGADPGTPGPGSDCLGCHGHGRVWAHAYVDPSGCDCHGDGGVNEVSWKTF